MTPPADIPPGLPDLRRVPLGELADPVTLARVLARVLPERPVETVSLGTAFSSSI